jgi:histidinol dehydrogenase
VRMLGIKEAYRVGGAQAVAGNGVRYEDHR